MTRHSFMDAQIERSTQGAVKASQPRGYIRTSDPKYPYKSNPLTFQDVALGASIRWCVSENSALQFFRSMPDPADALACLQVNAMPPDEFWQMPLTCPRCAKPTQAFGLCAECQKGEVAP